MFVAISSTLMGATQASAQSYDELMQKTQSGLAAYLPPATTPVVQKPTPTAAMISPTVIAPTPALWTPPAPAPAPAPAPTTLSALPTKPQQAIATDAAPLLSGLRLSTAMRGIRKEGNRLIVKYTFETATPLSASPHSTEKNFRVLDSTERGMVREVLDRDLSPRIPISFEPAVNPKDAYLRIMAADLSDSRRRSGLAVTQELGYATLPNPAGGQLVIGSGICATTKPNCTLLKSTIRHEMGHVLGLRHPQDAGSEAHQMQSIMQATSSEYHDYQPQDIASLQQLYGTANGTTAVALQSSPAATEGQTAAATPSHIPDSLLSLLHKMLGNDEHRGE